MVGRLSQEPAEALDEERALWVRLARALRLTTPGERLGERAASRFPSRDDGPQGRAWLPAVPACGAGTMNGRAFKFSLKTEDGETHRFLLTRSSATWLAMTFIAALFPRLSGRHPARPLSHWLKSSGMPRRDGSPQDGQAV